MEDREYVAQSRIVGDEDSRYEQQRERVEVQERSERADARKAFIRHADRMGRLAALEQKVEELELRLSELSYRVAV